MIFGKTKEQIYLEEQIKFREQIYGVRCYAWWPFTRLQNGQYIWRQHYWIYYPGSVDRDGKLSLWSASPKRYTDQSINHVYLTEPRTEGGRLSHFWFDECENLPSKEEVFYYRPTPKILNVPPKKP